MKESSRPACGDMRTLFRTPRFLRNASSRSLAFQLSLASIMFLFGSGAVAQVNVLTQHNDNARTGQNLQETVLTPSNVNPTQFGQLFQQPVSGQVIAQPLYVSQLAIPGKGTHNVVYVATGKLTDRIGELCLRRRHQRRDQRGSPVAGITPRPTRTLTETRRNGVVGNAGDRSGFSDDVRSQFRVAEFGRYLSTSRPRHYNRCGEVRRSGSDSGFGTGKR